MGVVIIAGGNPGMYVPGTVRLPSGYTQLAYIQSSGTQRIDTGFKPDEHSRVLIDADILSTNTGTDHHLGSVFSNSQYWTMRLRSDRSGFAARYDGQALTNVAHTGEVFGRHTFDQNKNTVQVDSAEPTTFANNVIWNATANLPIFCYTGNGTSFSGYISMKLYSEKIWDGETLVRNFIPCINPDGAVGLYDTVNSTFYGNAGTGVFFAGPPKVSLPSGYKQLEYIQSSGTQYIDTEFIPNQDSRFVYDCERLSTAAAEHFFGVRTGNSAVAAFCFYIYNSGWRYAYNNATLTGTDPSSGRYTFDANKNIARINGNAVMNGSYATFTSAASALLFGMRSAPSGLSYGSHKLFRCQIYDNATLVRNYIPCSNPAGVIGLYDLVNRKFYSNAGTGAFIGGEEV